MTTITEPWLWRLKNHKEGIQKIKVTLYFVNKGSLTRKNRASLSDLDPNLINSVNSSQSEVEKELIV